jgi:hypothetical protein
MNSARIRLIACGFGFAIVTSLGGQTAPDSCDLVFGGSDRKAVKLRSPQEVKSYRRAGPISVTQFLALACKLDAKIRPEWRNQVPAGASSAAIQGLENGSVIVAGYLLGVRFEGQQGGDRDFHCEMSDSANWDSPHLVIEVPPGRDYCDARKYIWALVSANAASVGQQPPAKVWVFHKPPHVHAFGALFWDLHHGRSQTCTENGNRGIRFDGAASMVRGLWEVHPVVAVTAHGG